MLKIEMQAKLSSTILDSEPLKALGFKIWLLFSGPWSYCISCCYDWECGADHHRYAAGSSAHERRAEKKANKKDSKPGHCCRDGMRGAVAWIWYCSYCMQGLHAVLEDGRNKLVLGFDRGCLWCFMANGGALQDNDRKRPGFLGQYFRSTLVFSVGKP